MTPGTESLPQHGITFREQGYTILKSIFSLEALAGLGQALSIRMPADSGGTLEDQILAAERQDHALVYQGAQSVGTSGHAYRLLGQDRFQKAVFAAAGLNEDELHIMPLYLIVQPPGDRRFDYGWHQDRAYYPWCERMVAAWFPVNRATTAETGTIAVLPGSHRLPRPSKTHFRHGYFRQIDAEVSDTETACEQVLDLQLGDCCLMDGDLVHRSVANLCASPRVAAVARLVALPPKAAYERESFYCVHKS